MNSKPSASDDIHLDTGKLPCHVAVIMDGNGRWAQKRLLNRIVGHERGTETVREIVKTCRKIGIPYLTLYAFSTENWQRPKIEVAALMTLLKKFLESESRELQEKNIRLNAIGQIERLPDGVRASLEETMQMTRDNDALCLSLALSYGGRSEILRMVRNISESVASGDIQPDALTEEMVNAHLYTADIPDPDLLIRTSGEMRISNFLLWQIAYSEIYVTPTLWPDFGGDEFIKIINDYQNRDRRFGKVNP